MPCKGLGLGWCMSSLSTQGPKRPSINRSIIMEQSKGARTPDPLVANSGHDGRPGVSEHGSGRSKPRKPCRSHGRCCSALLYCTAVLLPGNSEESPSTSKPMTCSLRGSYAHGGTPLAWPASAASTKAIQLGQHDQIDGMYAQMRPPEPRSSSQLALFKSGCGMPHLAIDTRLSNWLWGLGPHLRESSDNRHRRRAGRPRPA